MSQSTGSLGCTCAELHIGSEPSGSYNLNLDCPLHGTDSAWWKSPEQVVRRDEQSDRLRILQAKARAARELGRGCSTAERLEPVGECDVCDLARQRLDQRQGRVYDTRPHAVALKALGMTLFCGGPGNRRDANRFLSLSDEDKLSANERAAWLYDRNPPVGGLTVARCWKTALDECFDPEVIH